MYTYTNTRMYHTSKAYLLRHLTGLINNNYIICIVLNDYMNDSYKSHNNFNMWLLLLCAK